MSDPVDTFPQNTAIGISTSPVGLPDHPLTFAPENLKSSSFSESDPYPTLGTNNPSHPEGLPSDLELNPITQAKLDEIDQEQVITDRVSQGNSDVELANNLEEDVNEISKISKPDDLEVGADNSGDLADIGNSGGAVEKIGGNDQMMNE